MRGKIQTVSQYVSEQNITEPFFSDMGPHEIH